MPIKIGKSKSSSGSELIHTNSCPDDGSNQSKKNRGLKQFFNRSKGNSKVPTGRSSATEEPTQNIKGSRTLGKPLDNIIAHRTESSPVNLQTITCHSVSPKLYTNSCASSIEELSKVALNTNAISSSVVPCSQIKDVIFEEDYEDALLLKNRNAPCYKDDEEHLSKENIQQPIKTSHKISHGIYNEPNDSAPGLTKEIIETCRICQITPTNQFKEIRSRSGCDTDQLVGHPDIVVGGRCSTNSSSVGSAHTLSDSPAIACSSNSPQLNTDSNNSPCISVVPSAISPSLNPLSISIQANTQSVSGPPTVYSNSPKGNTIICHHPSSPFAPPSAAKPNSSSNPSTVANSTPSLSPMDMQDSRNQSSAPSFISRRPGRFGPQTPAKASHLREKENNDGNTSSPDVGHTQRPSERRSEYHKHPVYEEAWDLKLKRLCQDMVDRSNPLSMNISTDNVPLHGPVLPTHPANSISFNRPQSAAGARRRTDSPSSKYSTPPAVPPHRRSSAHIKMPHCDSFEDSKSFVENSQASQSASDCRESADSCPSQSGSQRSKPKHNINPTFDDQGVAADYDYAYNETWNMGVKFNMAINLSNSSSEAPVSQRKESILTSGYMDNIDSVDSEESSSLSTSQEATVQVKDSSLCGHSINVENSYEENCNVDNDSLSNDSYEEPWDVRHGRVISELTSARLIDPACVLSTHDQSTSSGAGTGAKNVPRSQRSQEYGGQNPGRQRSVSGSRLISSSAMVASINKNLPLDDQPWYHVNCSRTKAEHLLTDAMEGSFLVRRSETCKNDYSLTIRHSNEYLHMKISRTPRGFILGQYSQPYATIPHMLHHYTLTMVPVRGADSVMLRNPIVR